MRLPTVVTLLTFCVSSALAASSSVKIVTSEGAVNLRHLTATRLVQSDGTKKMYLLFAAKPAKEVVLVDAFGNEGLTLPEWTTTTGATAVKVSFTEGAEENFSLNVHEGAESRAIGGHNSGGDVRGMFRNLEIKGNRIRGEVQYNGATPLSGKFDTTFTTVKQAAPVAGVNIATTPQGKVLLAYAAAMRKLDFAAATKFSVRDEVAETNRMPNKSGLKKLMEMEFGTAASFEKLLATSATMTVDGDKAKIAVKHVQGDLTETSTFGLEKINGEWKVNY